MLSALYCLLVQPQSQPQPEPDAFTAEVRQSLPVLGQLLFTPGIQTLVPSGPTDVMRQSTEAGILTVEVLKPGATAFTAQVATPPSSAAIAPGDTVLAAFEVRSTAGGRETGEALFTLYGQQPAPPWQGLGSLSGTIGRQWRRFFFSARAAQAFPAGEFQITIHVSQQPQTFQFRAFTALNLGQNVDASKLPFNAVRYEGQELTAPWRKKAAQMIEQNRKAELTVAVTKGRRPVRNATVQVKLARHEYPFATFLDRNPMIQDADGAQYRKWVPQLFSQVTVPIYWSDWGWESETERKGYFDRFAWSRQQGLRMKAHNLVWPSFRWSPTRLQALRSDPPALRKTIVDEARERAKLLSSQPFVNVDVLNELRSEHEFADIVGKSLYKELFDIAKAAWPKAELVYNDYDVFEGGGHSLSSREATKAIIRRLQADKVPVTTLGWQGHFGESLTPPETVWKLIDEFKEFGLPLEITEFDVETRDEKAQADYTRDLMTAWFAHPRTTGFTIWGFHEAYHWKPQGAMFRRDWSPKPNLREWQRLTQEVWTTRATAKTSAKGEARLRGFRGEYEVKVTLGGATKTVKGKLTGKGSRLVVALD